MDAPEDTQYAVLTGNQVVAHNLRMARLLRGWTQEEAAEKLEPYLGVRWSKASYSAAERSQEKESRIRNFSADELLAFSLAFKLPVTWFLLPPEPDVRGRVPLIQTDPTRRDRGHHIGVLVEMVFGTPGGQAEQEQRLNAVLAQVPLEEQGRYMRLVSRVAGLAGVSAIKRTVGDLGTWISNLRDLAGLLEEAETKTVEDMSQALEEFVHLHQTEDTPEEASDAGSR